MDRELMVSAIATQPYGDENAITAQATWLPPGGAIDASGRSILDIGAMSLDAAAAVSRTSKSIFSRRVGSVRKSTYGD